MLTAAILTIVVLVLLVLAFQYIINPAPFEPMIKWGMGAICAIIAIAVIAGVWGLYPNDLHTHLN